ncbi:hypothetical protein FVEG_14081 [Fusarium verticillioides 7600]|uniref:Uncharacterized protein n=1 Tax=Gibberella moniliformis (strain M3125 / FGSC 7600) TaxID=334819 RepID=W7MX93_GIBM7|nr:hypothetical protein FVEG_14081 [Fusarium verticillioides 7600]EWG55981.1 hypothetical protein FVEG_14081 [Fusarium verticillioides 7600]
MPEETSVASSTSYEPGPALALGITSYRATRKKGIIQVGAVYNLIAPSHSELDRRR